MKRTRIAPRSRGFAVAVFEHEAIRAAVFERDGYRCLLGASSRAVRCVGRLTPHHLRKAGQGGPYAAENLVSLCEGCNGWVEDFPTTAYVLGLVCRAGDTLDECWERMRTAGLVV
jgi:hypothetical protein